VIDESHNFRNNTQGQARRRRQRHQAKPLRAADGGHHPGRRQDQGAAACPPRPVNNDLKDLRNQLYFVTEGRDHALMQTTGIASIKQTLDAAQKTFMNGPSAPASAMPVT
jgi:hypothetical protein